MTTPYLVYIIFIGIIISAYMTIKTAREDAVRELTEIEQEGEQYMNRLQNEKDRRKLLNR